MSLHFHDSLFAHFSFAQGKSIRCLCFAQLRTSFRLADNVASSADVRRDQRRRGLQVRWSRSWYSPPYSLKSSPASLKIRLSRTMASRRACSSSARLSRAALAACRISAVSETLRSNSWRHELPPAISPRPRPSALCVRYGARTCSMRGPAVAKRLIADCGRPRNRPLGAHHRILPVLIRLGGGTYQARNLVRKNQEEAALRS